MRISSKTRWRARDPLFRGDASEAVRPPSPKADRSVVRHILYLDGAGRETPYLSSSESFDVAERFAGQDGRVWEAFTASSRANGVAHLPLTELLNLLRGTGKGNARWKSAVEVQQARRYVEQHLEHLFDFSALGKLSTVELRSLLERLFVAARRP